MKTFLQIAREAEDMTPVQALSMLREIIHDDRFPAVLKLIADQELTCQMQFESRTSQTVDSHARLAHIAGSLATYRDIRGAFSEVIAEQMREAKKGPKRVPKGA